MTRLISAMWTAMFVALVGGSFGAAEPADTPYPTLVTAETRADAAKLSALERPGNIFRIRSRPKAENGYQIGSWAG